MIEDIESLKIMSNAVFEWEKLKDKFPQIRLNEEQIKYNVRQSKETIIDYLDQLIQELTELRAKLTYFEI